MRNSKKIILMGLFASIVIIGSLNPNNLVMGQEYSYSLLLVPDATYEWSVTTLVQTGDPDNDFLAYGAETIAQGDVLSAKILLDVNETALGDPLELYNLSKIWVEFYLDGENVSTDITEIGLYNLYWVGVGGYYFLEPTIYTNSTGAYDNFLIYHNTFPEVNIDSRIEVNAYAFHAVETLKTITTTKLSKDTWSFTYESTHDELIEDLTDPESWSKEHTVTTTNAELRYNRETGLLAYLQYTNSWHRTNEVEGSFDDDTNSLDLLIESTQLPTSASYGWTYGIAGLIIFSVVVIRRKRK